MDRLAWMSAVLALSAGPGLTAQSSIDGVPRHDVRPSVTAESQRSPLGRVDAAGRRSQSSTVWRAIAYGGVGLAAGAVAGALVWPLISTSSCRPENVVEESGTGCLEGLVFDGDKRREGAILFGVIGALVGTIVGVVTSPPHLDVTPVGGVTVSLTPRLTTPGIEGTIRF